MEDEEYLARLDEIDKLPDDESLKELAKLPPIDVFENWPDPEPISEAWKYRVNGYEDYESARNIVKPQFRDLYRPEKERHYSDEKAALEALLKKLPSNLIRPEKQRIVILLRAKGFSLTEICEKVELSKPTVIKIVRQFSSEISKLKKTELEELLHLYHFTLSERVRTFGKIQGILLAELETRSVKDIPTDRLIDLIIKCDKAVADYLLQKIASDADPDGKAGPAGLY